MHKEDHSCCWGHRKQVLPASKNNLHCCGWTECKYGNIINNCMLHGHTLTNQGVQQNLSSFAISCWERSRDQGQARDFVRPLTMERAATCQFTNSACVTSCTREWHDCNLQTLAEQRRGFINLKASAITRLLASSVTVTTKGRL